MPKGKIRKLGGSKTLLEDNVARVGMLVGEVGTALLEGLFAVLFAEVLEEGDFVDGFDEELDIVDRALLDGLL